MINKYMLRDARPTGGILPLDLASNMFSRVDHVEKRPVVVCAGGTVEDVRHFTGIADTLPWGSVIVFDHLQDEAREAAFPALERGEWRYWNPAGREPHETMWVRAHDHGDCSYSTHERYLLDAVGRTSGPVLELGCGDSSTPLLHGAVVLHGRTLTSIESTPEWLHKFETDWRHPLHHFEQRDDPATFLENNPTQWGVVFVDHAPGNTRKVAVERARDHAEIIVVHDSEDCGYEMWDTLESFRFKRHFRYMRPWTSVVSMTREIVDPYAKESTL